MHRRARKLVGSELARTCAITAANEHYHFDMNLSDFVRDVPDFPSDGIVFKDITPLLADPAALTHAIDMMSTPFAGAGITAVAGIEARGFLFGPSIAQRLDASFVPIRKPGKLPPPINHVEYALEYGSDRIEARDDAFGASDRVLLVDDVLATGGTLQAATSLVERAGASVVGISVLIELEALQGRVRLVDVPFTAPIGVA